MLSGFQEKTAGFRSLSGSSQDFDEFPNVFRFCFSAVHLLCSRLLSCFTTPWKICSSFNNDNSSRSRCSKASPHHYTTTTMLHNHHVLTGRWFNSFISGITGTILPETVNFFFFCPASKHSPKKLWQSSRLLILDTLLPPPTNFTFFRSLSYCVARNTNLERPAVFFSI